MAEKVTLTSGDDKNFECSSEVAQMSVTIHHMMEDLDNDDDTIIPLPSVEGKILEKVLEYCNKHVGEDKLEDEKKTQLQDWDTKFAEDLDQTTLFELMLAANFLDIKPLLELTCKTVANMIKGKTPEEIKEVFGIEGDFTPEEEEQVRKENPWLNESSD